MDNAALVGITGPDFEMDIERGKVREFARAVGAHQPEYLDDPCPLVPPTFLTTAAYFWGYSLERPRGTAFERIDHDLSLSLHAEEAYIFHGPPPRAGTRLTGRSSLESFTTRQGARGGELTFLVMLTEFREERGDLVAEARSTSVTTGETPVPKSGFDVPTYAPGFTGHDPVDRLGAIEPGGWESLGEGRGPDPVTLAPLTLREVVRYQGACGEDHPAHYDSAYARALGYPAPFSIGMLHAGVLASMATRWLGAENVRSFRARFRNIVWPGDVLRYSVRVERKHVEQGERTAELVLCCSRPGDEVVVDAWMRFVL